MNGNDEKYYQGSVPAANLLRRNTHRRTHSIPVRRRNRNHNLRNSPHTAHNPSLAHRTLHTRTLLPNFRKFFAIFEEKFSDFGASKMNF